MEQPEYRENRRQQNRHGGREPVGHSIDDEMRLFEYLDGELTAEHSAIVEEHLSQCTECRTLSRRWQQVDSELSSGLPRPSFSPGFVTRLRERVGTESPPSAAAERMRKRFQLEAELERQWVDYRKSLFCAHLPKFLDYLGYGTLCGIGGCLLFLLVNGLLKGFNGAPQAFLQVFVPTGAVIAAIFLLTALAFAKRAPFISWLDES